MKAILTSLVLAGAAPSLTVSTPPLQRCDAACLSGLARNFAAALPTRGASARLPWAPRVRYAENGVPMMIDDGVWATVTALGSAPLLVADPETGNAVWMGAIAEHGQPSFLAFRLKTEGRNVAEVEQVIRRQQGRPPFADPNAFAFDAGLTSPLPARARMSRARLAAVVRAYYAAIRGVAAAPKFAPDCTHTQNGVDQWQAEARRASGSGCAAPFVLGLFGDVEGVRGLSIPVIDAERGLVVALGTRDYAARSATLKVSDGSTRPADARFPHSYAFVTVFKIEGGAITRVQEVSSSVPYRMPVWSERP